MCQTSIGYELLDHAGRLDRERSEETEQLQLLCSSRPGHELSPLQLIALAALLHEYQSPIEGADEFDPTLTSGIPPPRESVEEGIEGHVCGAF